MNIVKRVASYDDRAVASIALGVAGLFFFNVVLGPIAVVLGAIATRRCRHDTPSRNAGLAGILLGVADLLVLAGLITTQMRHGGLSWHL